MIRLKNVYLLLTLIFSLSSFLFSDDYQLDVKASIEETEGVYNVSVDIESSLPENAALEITVSYVKKYFTPPNLRKPDQPEYETEQVELIAEKASVSQGKCTLKAGNYKRRPYVGDYQVKITFNPDDQPAEVKQKLPADTKPFEKEISFTYGNPDELEGQKKAVRKEIYGAIEEIKKLYDSLRAKTASYTQAGKFDAADWKKWQGDWKVKTDTIKKDNESRLEGWIYHMETVGKHSIDTLCIELAKLGTEYEKIAIVSDTIQKADTGFVNLTKNFDYQFDYELQKLGFGSIPDKPLVKSIMAEIEKNLGLTAELFSNSDKEKWAKSSAEYKDAIQKEIFKLTNATSDYIYATYLAPFTQDFVKYIAECAKAIESQKENETVNQLNAKLKKTIKEMKETLEIE